jgi:hypothetical protein
VKDADHAIRLADLCRDQVEAFDHVELKLAYGRFRDLTTPKAVYPVGIQRVTESDLPFLIASPTKALADRIAREPGFRSMADVARWLEGMRVETGGGLDREELIACAKHYGRPSVRWLLRLAEKNQLIRS